MDKSMFGKLKDGFDKVRQDVANSEVVTIASNTALKLAFNSLPQQLDLTQSKLMTQLVERGLQGLGYSKIKADGVPDNEVLKAMNDLRQKSGDRQLDSLANFSKDDFRLVLRGLQEAGTPQAKNALDTMSSGIRETVKDYVSRLPAVGATPAAPRDPANGG